MTAQQNTHVENQTLARLAPGLCSLAVFKQSERVKKAVKPP